MTRRPRRQPKPDRQRALALLASSPDGCSEAVMIAHGFTAAQLAELVQAGLATVTTERVLAGKKLVEIARVRIAAAGLRTIGDPV